MHEQGDEIVLHQVQLLRFRQQRLALPVQATRAQEGPHAHAQFVHVHRFAQEVVRTGLEASQPLTLLRKRGQQKNGEELVASQIADPAGDVKPVHAGHPHIEQHEVDGAFGEQAQSSLAVGCLEHAILALQQSAQQLAIDLAIVDYQYRFHAGGLRIYPLRLGAARCMGDIGGILDTNWTSTAAHESARPGLAAARFVPQARRPAE